MPDFKDLVKSKLKEEDREEAAELWEKIYNSYEEEGPRGVEELIFEQLNQLKKGASKELKGLKDIIPKKKKKRR